MLGSTQIPEDPPDVELVEDVVVQPVQVHFIGSIPVQFILIQSLTVNEHPEEEDDEDVDDVDDVEGQQQPKSQPGKAHSGTMHPSLAVLRFSLVPLHCILEKF
jgi:hypothetical protein